jgi:hypothetical protein
MAGPNSRSGRYINGSVHYLLGMIGWLRQPWANEVQPNYNQTLPHLGQTHGNRENQSRWPAPAGTGSTGPVFHIRCVIGFFIIVFLQVFFVYSSPPVHVYIRVSGLYMNTTAIHNIVYKASF